MGCELHWRRHFAISRSLCRHCSTSHPVPTVASPSILPRASDSFARQEEEDAEDAAARELFELDDPAGLAESDPVFASVFEDFDPPPELDASDEPPAAPFAPAAPLLASARLSVR
jgi:hypothetical protein